MIIYFDTETTGYRPGNICQLSYVMQSGKDAVARNMFFSVDKVEYGAYMVHGFSAEKLRSLSEGKRFCDYAEEIERDFNSADIVVAHNAAFDMMFMRVEFERLGKCFSVKKEFCSMKKSVPVCKLPKTCGKGYKYPKLSELCEHFGITEQGVVEKTAELFKVQANFHDARFDATALYLAMNDGMKRCDTLSALGDYL